MESDKRLVVKKLSSKEYERLGQAVEDVVSSGYISKRRLAGVSFLRGIFFGLGTTLGVSIILALILYLLTFFSDLPFVGTLFKKAQNTIDQVESK